MENGSTEAQRREYQRQMNGTGGDMPTGYRPCPFCHSVIPWESERCPSCGRVLIERVGSDALHAPSRDQQAPRRTSSWSASVRPVLARVREAVQRIVRGTVTGTSPGRGGSWATTSRGTSWSMFEPARRPVPSRWPGSIPAPTQRERQILITAAAVLVSLLLIALISR